MIKSENFFSLSEIDEENNNSYYKFINALKRRDNKNTSPINESCFFIKIDPFTPSRKVFIKLYPNSRMFLVENLLNSSRDLSSAVAHLDNCNNVFGGDNYDDADDYEFEFDDIEEDDDIDEVGRRRLNKKRQRGKIKFLNVLKFSECVDMRKVCKTLYYFLFTRLKFDPLRFFLNLFEYHFELGEDETYRKEATNFHAFKVFFRFETFSDCYLFLNTYNTLYTKSIHYKIPRLNIENIYVPIGCCDRMACLRGIVDVNSIEYSDLLEKYVKFILHPRVVGDDGFCGGGGSRGGFCDDDDGFLVGRGVKSMVKKNRKEKKIPRGGAKNIEIINSDFDATQKFFEFCYSEKYPISPKLKFHAILLFCKDNFPIDTLNNISGVIFNSMRYKTFY
nr:MAG: hypothetical protein [Porcellio scaber clopovirus]